MRLALATTWILAGAAVTGAAYWGLLNTPESTVLALASSALLVVVTLALLSLTLNGAIALWMNGASAAALTRSFRRIPTVVPALLVFAACWWIAQALDAWVALRSGEINAWFIAAFGWDDIAWLFAAIGAFTIWLRWVIGGLLALSLMGAMTATGWRAGIGPQWLRRGMRARTLIAGTLWFVALIALPWLYLVPWRPAWVPPTGVEFAFIVSKLSVAAILMAAGVALMIHEVMRVPQPPTDPGEQRLAA